MPSLNNKKSSISSRSSEILGTSRSGAGHFTTSTRNNRTEKRIINVSQKRQITLPLKYFQMLSLSDQVECSLEDGAIVIRPISKDSGEFSVEILKDLVAQGLSGDELIKKFAEQNQLIKNAIGRMLKEADDIANGEVKSASMIDIFGESEDV
jgi:hypothetical protein